MPKFPSAAWAAEYAQKLNENPAYAEAARAWEGDVMLLVLPDAIAPNGEGVRLDLFHGRCRSAEFVPDPRAARTEFTYEGSRGNWDRMLRREIDPVKSILDGTFRLRGNLAKAMRFTRAAKEMVETATLVPSDPGSPSG
jgi:putative sterol carrier protein